MKKSAIDAVMKSHKLWELGGCRLCHCFLEIHFYIPLHVYTFVFIMLFSSFILFIRFGCPIFHSQVCFGAHYSCILSFRSLLCILRLLLPCYIRTHLLRRMKASYSIREFIWRFSFPSSYLWHIVARTCIAIMRWAYVHSLSVL